MSSRRKRRRQHMEKKQVAVAMDTVMVMNNLISATSMLQKNKWRISDPYTKILKLTRTTQMPLF